MTTILFALIIIYPIVLIALAVFLKKKDLVFADKWVLAVKITIYSYLVIILFQLISPAFGISLKGDKADIIAGYLLYFLFPVFTFALFVYKKKSINIVAFSLSILFTIINLLLTIGPFGFATGIILGLQLSTIKNETNSHKEVVNNIHYEIRKTDYSTFSHDYQYLTLYKQVLLFLEKKEFESREFDLSANEVFHYKIMKEGQKTKFITFVQDQKIDEYNFQ